MRTILGFLPALFCAGAMIVCVRMMRARSDRRDESVHASRNADESETRDG